MCVLECGANVHIQPVQGRAPFDSLDILLVFWERANVLSIVLALLMDYRSVSLRPFGKDLTEVLAPPYNERGGYQRVRHGFGVGRNL